jgi:hypothetical protein
MVAAMHWFIWIVATLCTAVWSAMAWGLYKLLSLEPTWAADARGVIERLPYGDAIDRWWPGWREAAQIALEVTQSALGFVGGAAPVVAGVAWGLGLLLIVGTALVCSLIVWLLRERKPPARPPGQPPAQAVA